jgi:hypothetical protein
VAGQKGVVTSGLPKPRRSLTSTRTPIIKKCISRALEGDSRAISLCVEHILSPLRGSPVRMKLPKVENLEDTEVATQRLVGDLANGNITPQEAEKIYAILSDIRNHKAAEALEGRIAAVEQKLRDQAGDNLSG